MNDLQYSPKTGRDIPQTATAAGLNRPETLA